MSLVLATLLVAQFLTGQGQEEGIAVPAPPSFTIGQTAVFSCSMASVGTNPPKTTASTLTETAKGENGNVRSILMVMESEGSSHRLTLQTDKAGRPIGLKGMTNADDPKTALMLYMRQPLWPDGKTATKWQATLPNPFKNGPKTISVECSAAINRGMAMFARVVEQTQMVRIDDHHSIQITSALYVDPIGATVISRHEQVDTYEDGVKTVVSYDERPAPQTEPAPWG